MLNIINTSVKNLSALVEVVEKNEIVDKHIFDIIIKKFIKS